MTQHCIIGFHLLNTVTLHSFMESEMRNGTRRLQTQQIYPSKNLNEPFMTENMFYAFLGQFELIKLMKRNWRNPIQFASFLAAATTAATTAAGSCSTSVELEVFSGRLQRQNLPNGKPPDSTPLGDDTTLSPTLVIFY